jgi:hypothetical protein
LYYYDTAAQIGFVGYQASTNKMVIAQRVNVTNEIITVNQYGTLVVGAIEGTSISVSGNVSAGNLSLTGAFSPATLTATGNVRGGNLLTAGLITATGNISGNVFIGNGAGLTSIPGGNVTGTVLTASVAGTVTTAAQPNITSVGTLSSVSVTGNITGGIVSATGNLVSAANVLVAGDYVQLPVSDTNPDNPVIGALYYNTNIGGLRLWTGSAWDNV